jgi:hypothetical protein
MHWLLWLGGIAAIGYGTQFGIISTTHGQLGLVSGIVRHVLPKYRGKSKRRRSVDALSVSTSLYSAGCPFSPVLFAQIVHLLFLFPMDGFRRRKAATSNATRKNFVQTRQMGKFTQENEYVSAYLRFLEATRLSEPDLVRLKMNQNSSIAPALFWGRDKYIPLSDVIAVRAGKETPVFKRWAYRSLLLLCKTLL